jgi:tRNA-binding EMAP/Myf-like protein
MVGMRRERHNPKEVEGKQALFVINLEPKKMMDEVSEGMLLDIGYADGIKPVLAVPESPFQTERGPDNQNPTGRYREVRSGGDR